MAVCTLFKDGKSNNLDKVVTISLQQTIIVSLTGSVRKLSHIYPNRIVQAMHVNKVEPSTGEIEREDPATLIHLTRSKDRYPPRRG